MKRQCTEAENRIIRECGKDILTRPEIYRAVFKSSMIPVLLGLLAGLGLGAGVAQLLSVSSEIWVRLILVVCITITVEVFVLIWQVCNRNKKHKKRLPGNKFWVNGGNVIKYINHSEDGPLLVFVEDDLIDAAGKPCCITYPAPYSLNITPGERILLVYSDAGAYIPVRITEQTRNLVPEYEPQYIGSVNLNEAVCLPHPAAMDMDQASYMMNECEIKEAVKKCNRVKSIRTRNWIGIILFSFLILFLAAILFIALVTEDVITELSQALVFLAIVLVVWIILTCGFAGIVLAGHTRGLKKIQYKKKVMFCSVNDAYHNSIYEKYISVFEYINGNMELVSYPVTNNYFLPKDTPYGKIIYKYSKEAKSCAKDFNIFGLMK